MEKKKTISQPGYELVDLRLLQVDLDLELAVLLDEQLGIANLAGGLANLADNGAVEVATGHLGLHVAQPLAQLVELVGQ